ncbi:RNA ligase, Rnl2 family [Histomonas meleagridis]|uniref:RNA ligase, Rnl2 family n=1 Tax=Histomonas meleagridis TaxID=135588 RepID=UPI00355967CE|nr:RNA ligase, Rnl2 family [Histomonas meleagridis]KAH0797496.1 RNA ligase, Rnl2 family [Histomonas meleagridis]
MSEVFQKYSNIEIASRKKIIDTIRFGGYADPSIKWTASIKVDGAQFSIYVYPNESIKYSRRKGFLTDNDKFYDYKSAIKSESLDQKSIEIRHLLIEKGISSDNSTIIICGELFGGIYLHPDVPQEIVTPIQKRIQYAPGIHFYCFDIMVEKDGQFQYIDDDVVTEVCDKVKMTSHYVVKIGTFDECMQVPNNIPDPIGVEYYGLPPIQNNIIEGIVIKPVHPIMKNSARIILKNKNEIFAEKMDPRHLCPKKKEVKSDLSEKEEEILQHKMEYLTESRICSVISKIGQVSRRDFVMVRNDFIEDVNEDFMKDYGEEVENLKKEEYDQAKVDEKFMKEVTKWLGFRFKNYVTVKDN